MRLFTGFPVGVTFTQAASAHAASFGKIGGLRTVPGINLHVTACFIGEAAPDRLPGIKASTRDICARYQPITLNLKEICIWPKNKPYMVWALYEEHPEFTRMYRELEQSLTGFTGKGSVKPHVTLARFKEFTDIRQIPLSGAPFPERILCDRLVLFESKLASDGASYFSLEDYRLGEAHD